MRRVTITTIRYDLIGVFIKHWLRHTDNPPRAFKGKRLNALKHRLGMVGDGPFSERHIAPRCGMTKQGVRNVICEANRDMHKYFIKGEEI